MFERGIRDLVRDLVRPRQSQSDSSEFRVKVSV